MKRLAVRSDHWTARGALPSPVTGSDLCVGSDRKRSSIKKFILRNRLVEYRCTACGNDGEWRGRRLVLRLDHINGARNDNRISNLRFLCPNCDSQTDTFCGKNRERVVRPCADCGKHLKSDGALRCVKCHWDAVRSGVNAVEWPAIETLLSDVCRTSYKEVSVILGRDTSAVRKYLLDRVSPIPRNRMRDARSERSRKCDWPELSDLIEEVGRTSYVAVGKRLGVSNSAVHSHIRSRARVAEGTAL